ANTTATARNRNTGPKESSIVALPRRAGSLAVGSGPPRDPGTGSSRARSRCWAAYESISRVLRADGAGAGDDVRLAEAVVGDVGRAALALGYTLRRIEHGDLCSKQSAVSYQHTAHWI